MNASNDLVHTITRGSSFGENGFVLFTKRSGTVRAKSKVRVWAISRKNFLNHVLPSSKRLKTVFDKHANLHNGQNKMNHEGFFSALQDLERVSGEDTKRMKFLFELAVTKEFEFYLLFVLGY